MVAFGLTGWLAAETHQHRELAAAVEQARQQRANEAGPLRGSILPDLLGHDFEGKPRLIGANGQKTLVLVYSDSCPACTLNWPLWTRVRDAAERSGHRVVLLNLKGPESGAYREQHQLSAALYFPDPTTVLAYRLQYTPQTIMLGPRGDVVDVWTGVLDERAINRIGRLLVAGQ